jgi:hypothetical protein
LVSPVSGRSLFSWCFESQRLSPAIGVFKNSGRQLAFDLDQRAECARVLETTRLRLSRRISQIDMLRPPVGWPFFDRHKVMKAPRRPWSGDELKQALELRDAGRSYREIDRTLGRWPGATQQRLQIAGQGSKEHVKSFRPPDRLLTERDTLAAAREQRALTGYFCGDPPPGYSALHGKTGLR